MILKVGTDLTREAKLREIENLEGLKADNEKLQSFLENIIEYRQKRNMSFEEMKALYNESEERCKWIKKELDKIKSQL